MARRRLLEAAQPITFQASLPDAGDWLKTNKDESRLTLIVPLQVGAVLTGATDYLRDKVLLVTIAHDSTESAH